MKTATGSLAGQQQAFLKALYLPRQADALQTLASHADWAGTAGQNHLARGLLAYRSNGHALAQRVLAAAYPVVASLLGDEGFAALSRHFWLNHPPERGDMAQWGGEFAGFLLTLSDLMAEEPYMADVARLEWALHVAATQADGAADMASFSLLEQIEPSGLALLLAPGTAVLGSSFAVVSIVQAHLTDEVCLQQAGDALREGRSESAIVWRQGLKPSLRHAQPGEAVFIKTLQEKRCLSDSLAAAPDFDFGQWLLPAVQTGLLLGAAAL
ncbi:MAG: DNA-binding domain-containing protein [Pseudomonadota bacterium]